MLEIQDEVTEINKVLDNEKATSGYKLTKLQEAMADERDSLYKVENDLVLPFALKKCSCMSLTD